MNNKSLNFPIKIVIAYLIFTKLLFFWGPWEYTEYNQTLLIVLFIFSTLFLYLGYKFGLLLKNKYSVNYSKNSDRTNEILKFLKISTIISLITCIPDFLYTTHVINFSLSEIFMMIWKGFTDSYQNYSNTLKYINSNSLSESIFVAINVFLYFFRFSILPLSIIYWSKLGKLQKSATIFLTILECLKWLLKGMNKGVFDLVLIFSASLLISIFSNKKLNRKRIKKKLKKSFIITIIFGISAITMFIRNLESRTQGNSISYYNSQMGLYADNQNFILNFFPQSLHKGILSFSTYLTQGYYAVSMGLGLKFEPTFGFGHNMFFISNLSQYLDVDLWSKTYMVRVSENYNWDSLVNWHSLYSWIANDVSFIGVPIVLFVIGIFFSYWWKDAIIYKNPFASILFIYLFIEIFYIPANNQIGAYPYMTVAFYITIIVWALTRKKYTQNTK